MQYPVTYGLLGLFALMYGWSVWEGWSGAFDGSLFWGPSEEILILLGAMSRTEVYHGELWRLATAGTLHANILHLVLNGWALLVLGRLCEDIFGTIFTAAIFWASAIMGAILSCSMGTELSVGASGGVLGCLFAISAIGLRDYKYYPKEAQESFRILTILGVLNLGLGFFIPMVDNAAHLGGTLMGFGLGLCGPEIGLRDDEDIL